MHQVLLKLNEVTAVVRLGRSTIYLMVADGRFPKPVKLGKRSTGWIAVEVHDWLNARIAARSNSVRER
jgi:prophage regulatory protein